jgi:hypothetical protein
MRSFFRFVKRTTDLGVGTRDLGLVQFQTLPLNVAYLGDTGRRKWNIQRSLGPVNSPGFMIMNAAYVGVGMRGSGLGISGQYVLQSLAQTKDNKQ